MPAATLKDLLVERILAEGPLSIEEYMQACLYHPEHGFYKQLNPIGRLGDFTTAPEISQLFGEIIGLWIVDCWTQMDMPTDILLVELGPGRGTLMVDAIRAIERVSDMPIDLHLVETSPTMRAEQEKRLSATWHDSLETIPKKPVLLIANEFFDALPIRQYRKLTSGWAEVCVGIDASNTTFELVDIELSVEEYPLVTTTDKNIVPDEIIEICQQGIETIGQISRHLASAGGAALITDYGYSGSLSGDSLQAVASHQFVAFLDQPGTSDLTAHVDFGALAAVAIENGVNPLGPIDQGYFLTALGINIRASMLQKNASAAEAQDVDLAVQRLCAPDQMGVIFKALCVTDREIKPAGFEV